jgi:hypothetical protein
MLSTAGPAADPIGELKQRSADQRWSQLRGEFVSTPVGASPSATPHARNDGVLTVPALPVGAAPGLPQPIQPVAPPQWNVPPAPESSAAPFIPPAPVDAPASLTGEFIFTAGDGQQPGAKADALPTSQNLLVEGFLAPGAEPAVVQAEPSVTPAPFPIPSEPAPGVPAREAAPPLPEESFQPLPLQTGPSNIPTTKYAPRPLNEILPYHDYSPEGLAICPSPEARCPIDVAPPIVNAERLFAPVEFYWQPSNLFYQPLYFEDPALERYGHTYGHDVQPLASLGRFGVQLVGLPYFMAIKPPHTCESPLGFFRPGECAPKQCERLPLNCEAAVIAAGVYTAIGFIFPF